MLSVFIFGDLLFVRLTTSHALPPSLPSIPSQANTPTTTKASSFLLPSTCVPLSWVVVRCSSVLPTKKCP